MYGDFECDFFVYTKSKLSIEFEVKISKSDFKADAEKVLKHKWLKSAFDGKRKDLFEDNTDIKMTAKIPNKFYYVVPAGLLNIKDIPYYAGLIWVGKYGLKFIKKAPVIHNEKWNWNNKLIDKFYYRYRALIANNMVVKMDYENVKKELKRLKNEL